VITLKEFINIIKGLYININKMAAKKTQTYISVELNWAEEQLTTWRAYIDAHPIHELVDRIEWKPTSRGGTMPMVIASIEQQLKAITELMTKYLQLLEVVDKLREKEESKVQLRGDSEVNGMMQNMMKK
jgi:hypothetical protein